MSLYRTIARFVSSGALALALAAPAAAQQTESRIVGKITDANGGVLPGVTVTITAAQTGAVRTVTESAEWGAYTPSDGVLLLKRDLLDQQIIDVHGRKVVRVNDVEIESVLAVLQQNVQLAQKTIRRAASLLTAQRACACASALKDAIITERARIPKKLRAQLKPIIGKYL